MKKFALCFAALAVVALLVPAAQAQVSYCYDLNSFCDDIQVNAWAVGGIQGTEIVALWDWTCNGTGTFVSGGKTQFGTHPTYPTVAAFQANFAIRGRFADLYGTFDGVTTFPFQLSTGITKEAGACDPLHRQKKAGLRPSTGR